jgi:ribose transport system substrate-binding protein
MKRFALVLVMMVIASFAFANGGAEDSSDDTVTVGITTFDLVNPYWVKLVEGAQTKADEKGIELVVADPNDDNAKQLNALENFIAMGVDGIIVSALQPAATEQVLSDAQDAGIKIIAQSMETPVADIWVSAAEWDMGYTIGVEAGKWIRDRLNGEAEVLILANDQIPQMIIRKEGVIAGMTEYAPNAEVVAVQDANITELGMRVTENVVQSNPNLKVVVALNDAGALGALAAVESAGLASDDFFIGGVDATPEAREKIDGGTAFRASVDNIPYENGMMNIDLMLELLAGEDLEYKQVVPVKAYSQY